MVIDREGKVIAWNKAIEDMTGVRAEEMLGKGNYEYAIPFYGERRPMSHRSGIAAKRGNTEKVSNDKVARGCPRR